MPLLQSYAVWNNKGGVGKSTLTFHMASRYAQLHPDHRVLVIDMCPQANVSMMFLGGGVQGEQCLVQLCAGAAPRTIVGYLGEVLGGGPGAPLPHPSNYLIHIASGNQAIPQNLYLMCGDGNLEPMVPAINAVAAAQPLTANANPWLWVHQAVRNLIGGLDLVDTAPWVVFIDTNPSFGVYTEIAVSAANRLIVPVNADDSSRVAASAMFILLYGMSPPHPIYGNFTFAFKAQNSGLPRPLMHMIIGNRLTQYVGAATAFQSLSDATADELFQQFNMNSHRFVHRAATINSVNEFRQQYSRPLRDFNTVGVVAAHNGLPLSALQQRHYPVHGGNVRINMRDVTLCQQALDDVVATL